MSVRIRMARFGTKKKPFYRIVVADQEAKRDGRFIEVVGTYLPKGPFKKCEFKKERVEYWVSKGAQPSETVSQLLKKSKKIGMEKQA